jgi:hypothetical protein
MTPIWTTTRTAILAAGLLLLGAGGGTTQAFLSPRGAICKNPNGHVASSPRRRPPPNYSDHGDPTKNSASPPMAPPSSDSPTALHGIPKMFRWLTDQYPNINKRINDGLHVDRDVDNFYLDMNGIIHPCTHGNNNDEIIVLDETAMFKKIFSYVDR